jgi:predicted permease
MWSSLSESVVLAILGGTAGILLAVNAIALFKIYSPIDLPRMAEIQLNYGALSFALLLVAGSAVLFGIAPALRFVRTDPQQALQQNNGRMQGSRQGHRLRLTLIGLQVFGCTALLLITGLFAKSLATILSSARGFDTSNILTAEVSARARSYDDVQPRIHFADGVLDRLHRLPGVESVALVSAMPLEGETWLYDIQRPDKPNPHPPLWNMRWVSADYFRLLHERLLAGRFFESRDLNSNVAVISEASARAGWPGEDPVGKQFRFWNQPYTIIGVVADARTTSLKDTPPSTVYLPYHNVGLPLAMVFLVRTAQAPETLSSAVRHAIWEQDPEITISRVKTLDSQVKDSLAVERFQTSLLIAFGTAALFLAMVGIYGVLSYVIAGRTQEVGVRMALGATPRSIYSLTLSEAAMPVTIGLVAGWAASVAAGRVVHKLLYGVSAVDWLVTVVVTVLFIICATAAAFLPARRAARIDPMQALRVT